MPGAAPPACRARAFARALLAPSRRPWLMAVAALVAAYAAGLSDSWAIKPDSGFYLALGRSLAEGRGMEFNGVQMWAIPPAVPLLIAACLHLAAGHYWLINLVLRLMALGTALAASATMWRLGEDLPADRRNRLALGTLLVVGFSARLFADATNILTDVPFAFLISLGLYSFVRASRGHWGWCLAGSVALLAATLARLLGTLFLLGTVATMLPLLLRKGCRRHLLATAAGGAILVASTWAWMAYVRSQADPGSADYLAAVYPDRFNPLTGALWGQVAKGLTLMPGAVCEAIAGQKLDWVNLVPAAIVAFGLIMALRRRQWLAVVPAIVYGGFLLVWGSAAAAPRYLLPAMPMLAYALLLGVDELGEWIRGPRPQPRIAPVTIVVAVCLAISLPKVARDICWMRQSDFYAAYDHGKWKAVVDLSRYLAQNGRPESDCVVTPDPAIVHYLSRLKVLVRPLWENHSPWNAEAIPPDVYADAGVRSGARWVVVPTDRKDRDGKDWSGPAMERLTATGAFLAPRPFGNLVLYERRPAGG